MYTGPYIATELLANHGRGLRAEIGRKIGYAEIDFGAVEYRLAAAGGTGVSFERNLGITWAETVVPISSPAQFGTAATILASVSFDWEPIGQFMTIRLYAGAVNTELDAADILTAVKFQLMVIGR